MRHAVANTNRLFVFPLYIYILPFAICATGLYKHCKRRDLPQLIGTAESVVSRINCQAI